jgi:regulator of sigma E protease
MINIISFLIVITIIIGVHELGHLIAARLCGVPVYKFSIGFGPRLYTIKRGDTEYIFSLIPIGGYVSFSKDSDSDFDVMRTISPVKSIIIGLSGSVFNMILAFILTFGILFVYADASLILSINKAIDFLSNLMAIWVNSAKDITSNLGGPISIAKSTGDAAQEGIIPLILLTAAYSYMIGLFNLLPIPVLDGGQIAISVIELIRRKKFSEKAILGINGAGVIAIFVLLGFAVYNDILSLF